MVKNKVIKNKGKSIRDRLLILSKKASYEYNLLLTRYVQERMLFRLSQSKYKDQLTFLDVGKLIQEKMKPYWEALSPKE